MTPDPIKALVDLEPELQRKLRTDHNICLFSDELKAILAAIEALKPVVDVVMVPSTLLNDIRSVADMGGRRIETSMDACDKIIELIDMERQLGPASPAPSDAGRVERIVKAFERVLLDIDFTIEQGILPDIRNDIIYVEARAALAAIKEGE